MAFAMEDTQNSDPSQPTVHEVAKLSAIPRRQDAQSVTKRYTSFKLSIGLSLAQLTIWLGYKLN